MGKHSENVVTIKDIAARCGVSISTVSNVLNGKTKKVSKEVADKIHEVVEQTGYRPNVLAKSLRATSTKTIGVIVEDLILFSTSPIIEGIMQCCEEQGYSVVIENMRLFGRWDDKWMNDDSLFQSALKPVLNKMEALKVDGIVYISSYEHIIKFNYESDEIPMVFVYAANDDGKTPSFRLDDEAGGYMSYKYLIDKGHKRIGVIAAEAENPHTVNRLRGIQRAMFEAGILFDPSLVTHQNWNQDGGYNGMKVLIDKDISAVLCMSDLIATGVYSYLEEKGLRPGEDMSIIGYDNRDISALLYPPLTTIALPLHKMGYEAVGRLFKFFDLRDQKKDFDSKDLELEIDVRIEGELIERESVAQR